MASVLRPNYRRARALKLELDAAQNLYDQAIVDGDQELVEQLESEIGYLKKEFELTGVTSEYDL